MHLYSGVITAGDRRRNDMSKKNRKNAVWFDRKHYMWFPFSFTKYYIKNDRLYKDTGLLNSESEELLLYRVVDVSLKRSLKQKLYGTGTIELAVRVDRDSIVKLENIKRPKVVKDMISSLVENIRYEKRVVGSEFFGGGNFNHPPMMDGHDMDMGGMDMDNFDL